MSSRGRSPMKAKQKAAQARPYTPKQAMEYVKCGCDPKPPKIPGWLIDWFAEQKMTGGFRYGICRDCNEAFSANGRCACFPARRPLPQPSRKRARRPLTGARHSR